MKKFMALILSLVMLFSLSTVAFAADFEDVTIDHNQYEAIEILETLGVIEGYGNNVYGPNDVLTRAQLCTMLTRAMYDIHYNIDGVFTDVPVNHWARAYIDTAYLHGLMVGYGNGVFGPEDQLSYTQTARTILNALGYGKLEWPIGVNAVAYELGLYNNVAVKDFESGCTRAHAAQMIYNAFDLELVKEYAGQHFGVDKYFLTDILGYEVTTKQVEHHIYIAFKNIATKEIVSTDIPVTNEITIYPGYGIGGDFGWGYKFSDKVNAKTYEIDWYWADGDLSNGVVLYVNGIEITNGTIEWFASCDSAIGIFDTDGNLISVHMTVNGYTWIPAMNYANGPEMPAELYNKVINDKNYNEKTSTITYFIIENEYDYVISNDIVYGFVTDHNTKSIWINDIRYTFETAHNYIDGDFVVIYFDYDGNICGHQEKQFAE